MALNPSTGCSECGHERDHNGPGGSCPTCNEQAQLGQYAPCQYVLPRASAEFTGTDWVVSMSSGAIRCHFSKGFGTMESAQRLAEAEAARINKGIEFDARWMAGLAR